MRQHSPLPTLSSLGVKDFADDTINPQKDAEEWFTSFTKAVEAADVQAITDLFIDKSSWRDVLALTWDLRTFQDTSRIKVFLTDCLTPGKISALKLKRETVALLRPYPDFVWLQGFFDFETETGLCSGIFRLVPQVDGSWKAHLVFTNLEDLKGFPEKLGDLRNAEPNHGKWLEQRRVEREFENTEPVVVICGGGQSGLDLAARLKVIGIPTLIVEKANRIGDNWRNRYDALCLHDPVWYDHMPYLPFPSTWPVYTPALKLASWLENYAEALELNVWTSSTITSVNRDSKTGLWSVDVTRGPNNETRTLKPKHFVFATGLGGGLPRMPTYPGMDVFKGQILHSMQHKKAEDHAGKKVVVVGACTSAHDICVDYADHGVDVTMYQRSSTYVMSTKQGFKHLFAGTYQEGLPVEVADRLVASFPLIMSVEFAQRITKKIAEDDKDVLDGLNKVGFRTNLGTLDAGFGLLAWDKAGGYYLDVGGSQYIIDGKIKLKSGSQIASFSETGLKFEDGSELDADVVVFSTGIGDATEYVNKILSGDLGKQFTGVWGLDEEGEIKGVWKDCGIDNLWYMMGNLALCRFYSKRISLQIKAIEEGIFGTRYTK